MPRKRLSMRQVHEVLRLKWAVGLSDRQIARSLGLSRPTVAAYVQRAQAAGVQHIPRGLVCGHDHARHVAGLALAGDDRHVGLPLFERLKFLGIASMDAQVN